MVSSNYEKLDTFINFFKTKGIDVSLTAERAKCILDIIPCGFNVEIDSGSISKEELQVWIWNNNYSLITSLARHRNVILVEVNETSYKSYYYDYGCAWEYKQVQSDSIDIVVDAIKCL